MSGWLVKDKADVEGASENAGESYSVALVVFGVSWLALLVGTPFFIESHKMPAVFSPAYAFIAVGLIAGALLSKWIDARAPRAALRPLHILMLVVGVVAAVLLVVPEWYFHLRAFAGSALSMELIAPYVPLMVVFSDIPLAPFGDLTLLHHLLLCVAGLCCAYCLTSGRGGVAIKAEASSVVSCQVLDGEAARKAAVVSGLLSEERRSALFVSGIFVCGFLHIGIWGWFAHVYGSNWSDAVTHDSLGFMGSTIFAVAISVLLVCLIWLCFRRLGSSLRLLLFSFAAGELAWNLLSHCGDAVSSILVMAPAASVLLPIVEFAIFFLVFGGEGDRRAKNPEGFDDGADEGGRCAESLNDSGGGCGKDDGDSAAGSKSNDGGRLSVKGFDALSSDEEAKSDVLAKMAEDAKLTDRERQAVELALQGKNSAESASLIGVKPSTVRTYLHRSYQKLEVSGLEGLVAKLDPLPSSGSSLGIGKEGVGVQGSLFVSPNGRAADADLSEAGSDPSGNLLGAKTCIKEGVFSLRDPALLLLFGLFVLPHQYVGTVLSWGSSHSVVIGLGLGFMMAGGVLALFRGNPSEGPAGFAFFVVLSVAFCSSGLGFVGLQYLFAHGLLSLDKNAQLFYLALVSMAFSFCLGLFSAVLLGRGEEPGISGSLSSRLGCLIALAVILTSFAGDNIWLALCVVSLPACCLILLAGVRYSSEKASVKESRCVSGVHLQDCFLTIGALLPFGVIAGELWRGLQNPVLLGIYLVFLTAVLVVAFGWRSERIAIRKPLAVSAIVLLVCIAVLSGVPQALLLVALIVALGSCGGLRLFPYALCGFGLGLSAGRFGFDVWRDYLGAYFTTTESFGVNVAAAALGPACMVVVAVVGIACLLYLISLHSQADIPGINEATEDLDVLLLRGKGINELEASVLAGIARGMTGPQIARSLHYSLGTINSLRAHGYRELGVHSKRELKDLLESMR